MAAVSEADKLVRTTLYIVSPALANRAAMATGNGTEVGVRSRLYNPAHDHLFRPGSPNNPNNPEKSASNLEPDAQKEQENAKK